MEAQSDASIQINLFRNDTTVLTSRSAMFLGTVEHDPIFVNVSGTGVAIQSGTLSDTFSSDGNYLSINEGSGITPGFIIEFGFDSVIRFPKEVIFENVLYDGLASHEVEVQGKKCDGTYVDLRSAVKDFPSSANLNPESAYLRGFTVPDNRKDFACDGLFTVRIIHTSSGIISHEIYFDHIFLLDDHSSRSITLLDIHELNEGDTLSLGIKGDSGNISTWIDDVKFSTVKIGRDF
jgi:hypothetical protein